MLTVITDHWYTLTLPKQKGSQTLYQGARILNNRGLGLVPMARCLSLKYTKLILRPADSRPTLLTRRPYGHFLSSPLYLYHPYNSHCRSFLAFLCVRLLFFSNLQFLCNHQTSMQLCRFRERLSTTKAQRSFYFSTGCLPAAEAVCVSRTSVGCCRTPPFHLTTMTSPGSSPLTLAGLWNVSSLPKWFSLSQMDGNLVSSAKPGPGIRQFFSWAKTPRTLCSISPAPIYGNTVGSVIWGRQLYEAEGHIDIRMG